MVSYPPEKRIVTEATLASLGAGSDPEVIRDTIAAALVAGTNVTITPNDTANTITINATSGLTDPEVVRDTIGAALTAGSGITLTVNDTANTITIAADIETIRDTVGAVLVAGSGVTITPNDVANTVTIAASGAVGSGLAMGLVNIFDPLFGVVGDGVTNDRPAIQAYFDYLGAHGGYGIAYHPDKPEPTFLCAPFNLAIRDKPHGFSFDGGGCTFKFANPTPTSPPTPSNGFSIHNMNRVALRNFKIDGGGPTVTTHGISAYRCQDMIWEDITISNYGGVAILSFENPEDLGAGATKRNHMIRCIAFGNNVALNGFSHVQSIGSTIRDCEVFGLSMTGNPSYALQLKQGCNGCSIIGGYVDGARGGVAFGHEEIILQKNNSVVGVSVRNCVAGFICGVTDGSTVDIQIDMASNPLCLYGVYIGTESRHNVVRARVVNPPPNGTVVRIAEDNNRVDIENLTGLGTARFAWFEANSTSNTVVIGHSNDKTTVADFPVLNSGNASNLVIYDRNR